MNETPSGVALQTPPAPRPDIKPPQTPAHTQPPPPRPRRGIWIWLLLLIVAAVAGYYYWSKKKGSTAQPAATETGGGRRGGGRGGPGGPIPVVGVKATKGNIAVYYRALGAVTPLATVTIKSRVDGQLMSIHYKEGDIVHEGDLLAEIDPRPYDAALLQYQGQLIRDQALLDNARVDQVRYETLLKQNAIQEQQLATQKALVIQDEGTVKQDQGLIDAAKVNVAYTKIASPVTGRVGLRLVDPGNIVHAADTNGIVVVTQIQPISVIFTLAEDQLPIVLQKYARGEKLAADAFTRDNTTKISSGTLNTIDNQIDPTTGTLKLRANFNNSQNELFPNQFVNVRLLVQEKTNVTLLPTAAVQLNSQASYVYLVKPDSTVTVRNITTGTTEGGQTEITSGLNSGDTVVMTGVDKLQERSKVVVHFAGEKPADGSGQGSKQGHGQGSGGKGKKAS